MKQPTATKGKSYTSRLLDLEYKQWKTWLQVQAPYRWNILRLKPGRTLDIGCGIGRYLKFLSPESVGIDHNPHSIEYVKKLGLTGYTTATFIKSKDNKKATFDSLLVSHVLEHMSPSEAKALLEEFAPLLKKNGKIIICCPQEKGFTTDNTHETFFDAKALSQLLAQIGFVTTAARSFPFPRIVGRYFAYNEFVVVGEKA